MKRRAIPYSAAELAWLTANRGMVISDYHRAFKAEFGRDDVEMVHLHALRKRKGWKVDRAEPGRYIGRHVDRRYSAEELSFVEWRQAMSRPALRAAFVEKFGRADVTVDDIKSLCTRKGWVTGRTGCFEKGMTPANKGKRMPFNAASAKTQFKPGQRTGRANALYKPIGTERISKEGYRERKVHDGLPMQSRWKAVHRMEWEAKHGPLAGGMVLKRIGTDKLDANPSNWEAIPQAMLPRLNGRFGRGYDDAPPELKPTILAVAKLEHLARTKPKDSQHA